MRHARMWLLVTMISAGAAACVTQRSLSESAMPEPVAAEPVGEQPAVLATPTGNIAGTLRSPDGRGPVPVVLIIAGSGPTDRNGNTPALPGSNNSLKLLADGLAARGIASLRYDKRGVAGSAAAATRESELRFTTYIGDAAAWIRQLRGDRRFSTITVAGHSEGSLIGMVAAREAGGDGFISIAGAGRKPFEIISEQLAAQLPKETVDIAQSIMRRIEAGEKPDSIPPVLQPLFRPSVQPYLVSWFAYDPGAEIAKLDIPVLIVQGTTDMQVNVKDAQNLSAGRPAARLLMVEGMNHLMKAAPPGRQEQMQSYMDPSIPIVPKLLDETAGFVRLVKRKSA